MEEFHSSGGKYGGDEKFKHASRGNTKKPSVATPPKAAAATHTNGRKCAQGGAASQGEAASLLLALLGLLGILRFRFHVA